MTVTVLGNEKGTPTSQSLRRTPLSQQTCIVLLFALGTLLYTTYTFLPTVTLPYLLLPPPPIPTSPLPAVTSKVRWAPCGDNFHCANVSVPYDWYNVEDRRIFSLAVVRYRAVDINDRKGTVFFNPGGPGVSGTADIYDRSSTYSKILKGQYDLIGFDPRGVNMSKPYVSCFLSLLDAQLFGVSTNGFSLDLPSPSSLKDSSSISHIQQNFVHQINFRRAQAMSLAQKCSERTGEAIAFMGTEFIARDLEYLSRLIEGEDTPINYWGFSSGTDVGQMLLKLLPPHRIGKVVLDGVSDTYATMTYSNEGLSLGMRDLDRVLESFARACFDAKENCTLNTPPKLRGSSASQVNMTSKPLFDFDFTSPSTLLHSIDRLLDALYVSPIPVHGLSIPALATPSTLRIFLWWHVFDIASWPDLADRLSEVLYLGDWTEMVRLTRKKVDPTAAGRPDTSAYAGHVISCIDNKPYDSTHPPPSDAELASEMLHNLMSVGRLGDRFFQFELCDAWNQVQGNASIYPRRSRYAGDFEMHNGTLRTPVLLLSNTVDPVTPLHSAKTVLARLGDNARLVQQAGGVGHCTIAHASRCTAAKVRAYFLEGQVPDEMHGYCEVDQKAFEPLGWNDMEIPDGKWLQA